MTGAELRRTLETALPEDVVWAAMVWAQAHGLYSSMNAWGEGPCGRWMNRVLWEVSQRYPGGVAHLRFWGLDSWGDLRDQAQLRHRICDLCPDQVVPTAPWAFDWWDGEDLARGLRRLVERATEGDDRAIRLLDGRAWLEEQNEARHTGTVEERGCRSHPLADQIWRQIPASLLVKWVSRARHSGVDAARLLHALAVSAKPEEREAMEPDLLELATAADRNWVEKMCLDSLLTDPTWRPPALYAPLVWRIAERLELRELLRELVDAPGLLLPEARLRLREGNLRIESASDWIPQVEITSVGPDLDLGLRIHLDQLINVMEQRAHDAAMALYRLGERDPLRARWRTGPAYLTDLPLWRDGDRVERLLSIVVGDFPSPWCTVKELEALGTIQGQEWKEQTYLPVLVRSECGGQLARPWLLETLKSRADMLRPELQDIGRGARVLLHALPDQLPKEVEHLLTGGDRRIKVGSGHHGQHLHQHWRSQAATALLDLGDDGPLRAWAHAKDEPPDPEEADRPPTYRVERWLLDDRARLDWAWTVLRDEAQAGRLEGDQLLQVEWWLLAEGSDRTRFSGRSSHASSDASLPRPYVVAEAIRTSDVEVWMPLHDLNRRHPAWLEVIRAALQKAPDDRTRAALALDLSQHVQDPPELDRALRNWALTDPEPFLGGPTFDWRGGRAVGGVLPLLDALAARADTWVDDGLIRLWRLARVLPITDRHVRYETARWDEDRPAEPMVLEADADLPTPLAELARHLEARGLVGEILETWRSPPLDPAPQLEGDRDRPAWIRLWLRPVWLRLAETAVLRTELHRDTARFPLDVLDELIRRRTPDLEAYSAHLARETAPAILRPLLDLDPGSAVPIVADQAGRPGPTRRLELALALIDAGSPRFLHLGALRTLRDAVDALEPEQASITSAEG